MKLCRAGLHDLDDLAMVYITPSTGRRECGPCNRARSRAWIAANTERARANRRAWYVANLDRVRANARTYARVQYAADSAHQIANAHNQKARRRAAIGDDRVAAADQAALLAQPCAYCGEPATELDHIVPLRPRVGESAGRHVRENLAPACSTCNRAKGNKPLDIWLARRAA